MNLKIFAVYFLHCNVQPKNPLFLSMWLLMHIENYIDNNLYPTQISSRYDAMAIAWFSVIIKLNVFFLNIAR